MPVPTFAIVHGDVRNHYFPNRIDFSGSTKPTSTTVGQMIDAEAARLSGALAAIDVSASTLSTDAGATYPASYAWCQDTIRLGAAVRVFFALSGAGPVYDAWRADLDARYKDLEDNGHSALGDAPQPAQLGPRSHVSSNDLDRGDLELMSDAIPRFRKSDEM
jgi:hypothetical protein